MRLDRLTKQRTVTSAIECTRCGYRQTFKVEVPPPPTPLGTEVPTLQAAIAAGWSPVYVGGRILCPRCRGR